MRSALEAGVAGYVLFECNRQEVIDCVHDVGVGARYVCATAACRVADSLSHAALPHREIEVLQLLVKGYCNKSIGRRLAIATGTVKAHVKNVLEKLGALTARMPWPWRTWLDSAYPPDRGAASSSIVPSIEQRACDRGSAIKGTLVASRFDRWRRFEQRRPCSLSQQITLKKPKHPISAVFVAKMPQRPRQYWNLAY